MNTEQNHTINISALSTHPKNPRIHSDEQIKAIRNSIREVGFIKPVVIDENNVILAGHGAVEAAKLEGLKEIPYHKVTGLTDAQKLEYVIADNKTTDLSYFDMDEIRALEKEIEEMGGNISATGFTEEDFEVDDLSGIEDFFVTQEQTDTKNLKTATCPHCGETFEL